MVRGNGSTRSLDERPGHFSSGNKIFGLTESRGIGFFIFYINPTCFDYIFYVLDVVRILEKTSGLHSKNGLKSQKVEGKDSKDSE